MHYLWCEVPVLKQQEHECENEHFYAELKPTCADGLIPAPLSVTLTTANSDIQAAGQRESGLAAHFKQGRKGLSGREEANH